MSFVLPCLALMAAAAAPIIAQMPTEAPGKPDPKRVTAGTYATDPFHTLVGWRVALKQLEQLASFLSGDSAEPPRATGQSQ